MPKTYTITEDACLIIWCYTVLQTGVSDSLNGDHNAAVTTISLNDASAFAASGKIRIEEEIIVYTGKSNNDLTDCTRGFEESAAASHADTTPVYQVTTAYSANLAATAVFDYFADNADIGSAIYFSKRAASDPGMSGLKFNIGTALIATDITLKWEAYSKDHTEWHNLPDLVDDTQGFTQLGVNRILWTCAQWWWIKSVNGANYSWARCRISAVNNLTEGGANITDTVKRRDNFLTISGGTAGDPITMEDIYQYAVSQGWTWITKIGDDYVRLPGTLSRFYHIKGFGIYGRVDNIFKETKCHIMFTPGYFCGDSTSEFHFGETYGWTEDGNQLLAQKGCVLVFGGWAYDWAVHWVCKQHRFYDTCVYLNASSVVNYSTDFDLVNACFIAPWHAAGHFITQGGRQVSWQATTGPVLVSTYLAPAGYAWSFPNSILYSGYAYGGTPGLLIRDARLATLAVLSFTKTVAYDIKYQTLSLHPYVSNAAYIHNSLSLTVQDRNGSAIIGATVSFKDKDGNTVQYWSGDLATGGLVDLLDQTTDADGKVKVDILRYKVWRDAGGVQSDYTYTPHTVTISRTGYHTKVIRYTMDRKREEIKVLENRREV